MKVLREIFSDESGRLSSTRIIGAIIVFSGLGFFSFGDAKSAATILASGIYLLLGGQGKSGLVSGASAVTSYFQSVATAKTTTVTASATMGNPPTVTGPTTPNDKKGAGDAKVS